MHIGSYDDVLELIGFMLFQGNKVTKENHELDKDEQTIVVETRQYSRHYILWDIPSQITD
jgi:hypothetical protein